MTTVAGTGTSSALEDGIQAATASVCGPASVAVDNAGNLLHRRSRKWPGLQGGYLGNPHHHCRGGMNGVPEAGPATTASLSFPKRLAVDNRGRVYVTERTHIRLLTPIGATPVPAGGADRGGRGLGDGHFLN
jgi:hypothetical protein